MPNRAERREGSVSDVAARAKAMADGYEARIRRQVEVINRLQAARHSAEQAAAGMSQSLLIMVQALGGEFQIPKDTKIEDDDVLISEDVGDFVVVRIVKQKDVEEPTDD